LHKEINSDDLIKNAINYYSRGKEKKYNGISWYLYGCIYRQHNKNKEAILAFKKAEDILQKTNEENIKGLIYFNIGYISMQDELYAHSLDYFKKALNCFQHSNNKKFQAYAYRDISYVCTELKCADKIISQNLDIALKLANESNDSANYYDILVRKGKRIYNTDYNNSKKYIHQGYNFFPEQRPYYAAYLAYVYSKLNNIDSANYYLRVSLENKSNSQYKIIG
jgi:tetratricopeptide (TPR) repeat protein